ncbi:hypothetical protein BKA59DRAFT_401375 [Fusarium tricinctum]|uniref:LysM domain-containing protein n=1 Tax=Fusarium tricinctum TaxID=61284 RepID=A0A8K0RVJ4_9HYPO|nr:hypothetical protein BKA59DRAFT_401375 [Fusarium tricinctum]
MRFASIIVKGLLTAGTTAARGRILRRQVNPGAPTDPGITSDCTFYDTWLDDGIDCSLWLADWYITPEQFTQYNPSVKKDCSGIQIGHSYCVEVNHGMPIESDKPKVTSTENSEPEPEPTKDLKPSPTQEGLTESCTSFYKAKKGDTCAKIIAEHGTFDFDEFFNWNPAIEKDCSGIWASTWYCVAVPGTPTSPPSQTIMTTTKPTGVPKPTQTQEGLIQSCSSFHMAGKGETCAKIISKFGISDFDTFYKWNPAVGKDCSGIWASYYYCVSVSGTPTKPSVTSKPTATGGIETPSPIQEGMVKKCNKFHLIASTTTCSSIESYYNLPLSQFLLWNPAIEKDCSSLWKGYWVCVSVEGYKPSTTTKVTSTTQLPANGIQTPSPIQNGIVKNCNKFHQITSTTTCTSIESYYKVPLATFLSWNPAVGKSCTSLLVGYWVCVATVGWKPPTKTTTKAATTTKGSSNGIKTPPPVQDGMVGNCNKFHMVQKTTTCASIQDYYKLPLTDFVKWNPAVGKDCKGLWAGYNVCIGVVGGTPTKPSNGVETPSPIRTGMVGNCKKFHLVQSTTTCASIQKYYKISLAQLTRWNPAIGTKCTALWAKYWVCVGV